MILQNQLGKMVSLVVKNIDEDQLESLLSDLLEIGLSDKTTAEKVKLIADKVLDIAEDIGDWYIDLTCLVVRAALDIEDND